MNSSSILCSDQQHTASKNVIDNTDRQTKIHTLTHSRKLQKKLYKKKSIIDENKVK